MKEQLEEDWLDARLREAAPYIDDAGFTARVVQSLPPRRSRFLRETILLAITLLASVVTYAVSDGGRFLVNAVNRLAALPLAFICLVAICSALLLTGVAFAAAFSSERGESLG